MANAVCRQKFYGTVRRYDAWRNSTESALFTTITLSQLPVDALNTSFEVNY